MATKEEAYNLMQQGYCVSHKLFGPNEYIWMDGNNCCVLKDECGNDFETAWDLQDKDNENKWQFGWYIFKGNTGTDSKHPITQLSHQVGMKCPGSNKCLQYRYDDSACDICDIGEDDRIKKIESRPSLLQIMENANYEKDNRLLSTILGHDPVSSGIELATGVQGHIAEIPIIEPELIDYDDDDNLEPEIKVKKKDSFISRLFKRKGKK